MHRIGYSRHLFPLSSSCRGYGESDHPLDKKGYSIGNLVKDIVELVGVGCGASVFICLLVHMSVC